MLTGISAIDFFSEGGLLSGYKMPEQPKSRLMKVGTTAGFKPPKDDPAFIDRFNLALEVTGLKIADLLLLSVRRGLEAAVAETMKWRAEARRAYEAGGNGQDQDKPPRKK